MEKQTLETKKIVHNNISYLQYDLAKDQANTSFFDISDINTIKDLRQEGLQEMHFLNLAQGEFSVDYPLLTKYLSTTFRI